MRAAEAFDLVILGSGSTAFTPSSFFMATLTAWAHTAQSMPNTDRRTSFNSAKANAGASTIRTSADFRIEFIFRSFIAPVS